MSLLLALVLAAAAAEPVLTKAPELQGFVEATFPPEESGHTGSVVLALTLAADGSVEDVQVTESAGPAFDAAAVAAARQFRFSPAEVDGVPSRIRILYRYDFVEEVELPTTGVFAGVVRDQDTHAPLAGVTVTLSEGLRTTTDAEGHFEFSAVTPGMEQVSLEGPGFTALSTEETFTAGERLEATYDVAQAAPEEDGGDDLEIVVTAPSLSREAVSTAVAADEARKVPGTAGDVLKVVENLPGVARAAMGTGALVVWGAAPEDTQVYVDGVPVPRLYHDGGLRSVVGSDFVKDVALVPGGYGAANGRGLGGLVNVTTARFDDAWHATVSADVFDGAAAVHGPIDRTVNVGAAARYGWAGPLLSRFYPEVEDYFPIPHDYDGQLRVGFDLPGGGTLDVTGLLSSDETRSTAPSTDPAREASETSAVSFQRLSLRYARDLGDGSTVTAVVYGGADHSAETQTYGELATSLTVDALDGGARAAWRTRIFRWLGAEAGVDAAVVASDVAQEGSIGLPAREGDLYVFGEPPPDQVSSDRFSVVTIDPAPYAEADVGLFRDTLHLVPGLRFDPYARSVSRASPQVGTSPTHGLFLRDPAFEPRLSARWTPTRQLRFTAAWGRYHQDPAATDLSASFGNPSLPTASADHYVLGAGVTPVAPLSVDVTGFYTRSTALAVRNPSDQPSRAEALVADGEGRSYGAQAMVRLDPTHHWSGWLSYTLAWSERRDGADEAWRPSDYDQRHVGTALASYELPLGFSAAVRLRVATGYPRTEVLGSYYDDRRDLYQPIFGSPNGERLPTFFSADARVAKTFHLGRSQLEVSAEVQNLTDHDNVEEYIYNADYSERGTISGLPILPFLGLRWSL